MMATASSRHEGGNGKLQRFSASNPCPICGGHDGAPRGRGERCFGFISGDGQYAHCSREEHGGQAPFNAATQTYAHRLHGPCKCGTEHGPEEPKAVRRVIEKAYDYSRETGGPVVFQAVRYRPKGFKQRRPDGQGGWIWDLEGVEPFPYRRPEMLAADPAEWVHLNEGEKAVDRLRTFGLVATCSPMGAGKWRDTYAEDFRGRKVAIIPDNDKVGRDHARTVARSLHGVAAEVRIVELPGVPEKGDVVDYLDHGHSIGDLRALVEAAAPWEPEDAGGSGAGVPRGGWLPYREDINRLVHLAEGKNGQIIPIVLSNFSARITEQVERHERGEVRRQYRVEAIHSDGSRAEALVDAEDFDAMGWVPAQLGAKWAIAAGRGMRDHVRAAIQLLSHRDGIGRRTVHTSTGWVEHEGRPLYLHAGGAIGADGPDASISVDITRALAQYRLPDPPKDRAEVRAMIRAVLDLLDLAQPGRPGSAAAAAIVTTAPLRAVLGPFDATPHFSGCSGSRKTSLGRLALQFFSSTVRKDDRAPAAWRSTAGALQRYAFDCKDCLLFIDELTGDQAVAAATEFVQCQGNLKARDRMDTGFGIAPSLDPRGSVLSTGEADPTRQSALGRMLTVRFTPATVDLEVLTRCQNDADAGQYASAMAAYLRWLAEGDRIAREVAGHRERVRATTDRLRDAVEGHDVHPRHPAIAAELVEAFRLFLGFAVEQGTFDDEAAKGYTGNVEEALLELVCNQADVQRERDPAWRFLDLLRSGLASKKFHLVDARSENAPEPYAKACGWHKDWLYQGNEAGQMLDWKIPPNSQLVGYIDIPDGLIYLEPQMARTVATTMARSQGDVFENPASIGRDLAKAKLIRVEREGQKERYTLEKRIPNVGKGRYLFMPISKVFEEDEGEGEQSVPVSPVATA
jgi:hypothetical protein